MNTILNSIQRTEHCLLLYFFFRRRFFEQNKKNRDCEYFRHELDVSKDNKEKDNPKRRNILQTETERKNSGQLWSCGEEIELK